jgi:hypothetical protein
MLVLFSSDAACRIENTVSFFSSSATGGREAAAGM